MPTLPDAAGSIPLRPAKSEYSSVAGSILHMQHTCIVRGVRNPVKISDIGFLKTEPNQPQNSKTENSVSAVRFSKQRLPRFGDGFSRCLIHSLSCSMIGSTVNVFFFMPYLCTSSSESLRLTISWTNSSRKYIISSVTHIKQHTVQKLNQKPKPNRKPQFFAKPNRKPNRSHFLLTAHPHALCKIPENSLASMGSSGMPWSAMTKHGEARSVGLGSRVKGRGLTDEACHKLKNYCIFSQLKWFPEQII